MNLEGRLIGNRYEILEKIGNGGMATVYKAQDKILRRYVAVKVLRDEFTTDEEFIKRFNTEAQAAASLTHPNIVSIYDVGHEENIYYIVMELVQGKTLKEIINESKSVVFFGGAGVSTESGIPDFRSKDGLYNQKYKCPPEEILSHTFFMNNTDEFYKFYKDKMNSLKYKPNITHIKLAELEKIGKIKFGVL